MSEDSQVPPTESKQYPSDYLLDDIMFLPDDVERLEIKRLLSNPARAKMTFNYLRGMNAHDEKYYSEKIHESKTAKDEDIYTGLWGWQVDSRLFIELLEIIMQIHQEDKIELVGMIKALRSESKVENKKLDRRIRYILSQGKEIDKDDKLILKELRKLFPPREDR